MTIQQDYQLRPHLEREFTGTGIIGPTSLASNMTANLRVAVENVGGGNTVLVQGRLLGQSAFATLATITGTSTGTTVDISLIDEVRFNCSVYSASGGTPKLIASSFFKSSSGGAGSQVFTGITPPSSTPAAVGSQYIDTAAGVSYISTGTSSSADWKITGYGSVTTFASTGTNQNNFAINAAFIVVTGSVTQANFSGILSNGTLKEVTFVNTLTGSNSVINFQHQNSSSTAANRIILSNEDSGLGAISATFNTSITFFYDTTVSRWRPKSQYIIPASTTHSGTITPTTQNFGGIKSFASLGARDLATGFIPGLVFAETIQGALQNDPNFLNYNSTSHRLAVGLSSASASVHATSTFPVVAPIASSATATLTVSPNLSAPGSATATQNTPTLGIVDGASASQDSGGTGYTATGNNIEYHLWVKNSTSWGIVPTDLNFTDDSSATPYAVTINWTGITSSLSSPVTVRIWRNLNSGGFTDYVDVAFSNMTYSDTNSGFTTVSEPPAPLTNDLGPANGDSRAYSAYSSGLDPESQPIYSASNNPYNMTEDVSGLPYLVTHVISGLPAGATSARILGNPVVNAGSPDSYIDGTAFTENAINWTTGTTVTPNTFGYLSDGSILNRAYDFYGTYTLAGEIVYSSLPQTLTTTDPNDGLYYYTILNMSTPLCKILRNINSAGYLSSVYGSLTFLDDGVTVWSSDVIVTPTTIFGPGFYAENCKIVADAGLRLSNPFVPTLSSDPGSTGDFAYDEDYFYVCIAPDTWKRVSIVTW